MKIKSDYQPKTELERKVMGYIDEKFDVINGDLAEFIESQREEIEALDPKKVIVRAMENNLDFSEYQSFIDVRQVLKARLYENKQMDKFEQV